MNTTFKARRGIFLVLIFAFAFSIRFLLISQGPFHLDALDLALQAQKTLQDFSLHYEHGSGYPLTVLVGAVFMAVFRIFGVTDPVFTVNVMSVFFGAAGVLAFFFLCEKLFDTRRAVFAALLLSCFGPHVAISTFGKSLTLSIFLSLTSAFFLLSYLKGEGRSRLFFSAFALGFCGAARLSDLLAALPLLILFFSFGGLRFVRIREAVAWGLIALLTTSVYYVPMFLDKGAEQFMMVLSSEQQARFLGPFSFIFSRSLGWLLSSLRPEGMLLALAGFGIMGIQGRRKEFRFLFFWALIFQLFYGNVSSSGVRYLVIGWVAFLAAQAYFLGNFKNRGAYVSIALLVWITTASLYQDLPTLVFRHRHNLQKDFARWVETKTPPDALVLAVDEALFLKFYGSREITERVVTCDPAEMEKFLQLSVCPALKSGRKVFVVSSAFTYDACRVFRKTLEKKYDVKNVGSRQNEDWHHALLNQTLFQESLYELKIKERP